MSSSDARTGLAWAGDRIDSSSVGCETPGCSETAVARWETIGGPSPEGVIRTYRCQTHPPRSGILGKLRGLER